MQTGQIKQLKVIFKNETKKFKRVADYQTLLKLTEKAFGESLPNNFKFFYSDVEGDLISINCQDDFEEALAEYQDQPLRLIVESSIDDAKKSFDPSAMNISLRQSIIQDSDRESLMQPSQGFQNTDRFRPLSSEFENVDMVSSRSFSYHNFDESDKTQTQRTLQTEADTAIVVNQATETQNLVNVGDMGCGTEQLQTENKGMSAQVQMSEIGSQATKNVNEVGCDAKIRTEEQSCQKDIVGKDMEVNCEIIQFAQKQEEDQEVVEPIECYKCHGSGIGKKKGPCKKCGGTGFIKSQFVNKMVEIMREDIKSYCTQSFQRMLIEHLNEKKAAQAEVIHKNIVCDGCECNPIVGIRYKCTVNPDYDLCEKCEAQKNHPYPMVKIRKPEQAPVKLICSFASIEGSGFKAQKKPQEQQVFYNARFLNESFGDKHEILPNYSFTKQWTFRNDGETAWPEGVIFLQTNGDELQSVPFALDRIVQVGEQISVTVSMKSPSLPGNYQAFFRFTYGDNKRFGQKVWCNILVKEPENQSMVDDHIQPQQISESQQVEDLIQEEIKIQEDKDDEEKEKEKEIDKEKDKERKSSLIESVVEDKKNDEIQKDSNMISESVQIQSDYMTKVDNCNGDEVTKTALLQLSSMGYTNFDENFALLKQYNNDLVMVIHILCNRVEGQYF